MMPETISSGIFKCKECLPPSKQPKPPRSGQQKRKIKSYLNQLQRPSLNIPLPLRNPPNIIINKQPLSRNPQDQSISHAPHTTNQLTTRRLNKHVIKRVYSLDNDLIRIFIGIAASLRWRRSGASCGVRGSVVR